MCVVSVACLLQVAASRHPRRATCHPPPLALLPAGWPAGRHDADPGLPRGGGPEPGRHRGRHRRGEGQVQGHQVPLSPAYTQPAVSRPTTVPAHLPAGLVRGQGGTVGRPATPRTSRNMACASKRRSPFCEHESRFVVHFLFPSEGSARPGRTHCARVLSRPFAQRTSQFSAVTKTQLPVQSTAKACIHEQQSFWLIILPTNIVNPAIQPPPVSLRCPCIAQACLHRAPFVCCIPNASCY